MMELYLDLLSQPCRSVFMFAKVLGIPFEFKLVQLSAGVECESILKNIPACLRKLSKPKTCWEKKTRQHYSEEFGKISIVRKIPVMKDGSFTLTESTAILQYMVEKYGAADHWYPADLLQRARVNEYLSWQHMNLRAHGSKVFLFRSMYPIIMDAPVPADKMDGALEDLKQSLNLLEEKFLQNKPFIVGDKISLADLVAIVEIMQPVGTGLDVFEGRPQLIAWRARVKKELGEKLFNEAHEALMNTTSLQQTMQNSKELEMFKPFFQKIFR